jgi:hypothetical protein
VSYFAYSPSCFNLVFFRNLLKESNKFRTKTKRSKTALNTDRSLKGGTTLGAGPGKKGGGKSQRFCFLLNNKNVLQKTGT